MKLIKYLLFIVFLVVSLVFIINLMEENDETFIKETFYKTEVANQIYPNDANAEDSSIDQVMIKIPFSEEGSQGVKVWIFFLAVLTIGVLLGFIIALVQILSQKREIMYQKSKIKKLQLELNTLRNQSIEDDLVLIDDFEENKTSEEELIG